MNRLATWCLIGLWICFASANISAEVTSTQTSHKLPDELISLSVNQKAAQVHLMNIGMDYTLPQSMRFKAFVLPQKKQQVATRSSAIPGIYLSKGAISLARLIERVDDERLLSQSAAGFTLHVPLIIRDSAALVIENTTLLMDSAEPVFIYNQGVFYVSDSSLRGWHSQQQSAAKLTQTKIVTPWQQRPYIYAAASSTTFIRHSNIAHLGQPGEHYFSGLSLKANTRKELDALSIEHLHQATGQPAGTFVGNDFDNMFVGFRGEHLRKLTIQGNRFQSSVKQHLFIKEYADKLNLENNLFVDTKVAEGIYLSKIQTLLFRENIIKGSGGDGLYGYAIDSAEFLDNIVMLNKGNGLVINENRLSRFLNNIVVANAASGIKADDALQLMLTSNRLDNNGLYGARVFTQEQSDKTTAVVRLHNNSLSENYDAAISATGDIKVELQNNRYQGIGSASFDGALAEHTLTLIEQNSDGVTLCLKVEGACSD
ncbi:MAG: right-handed parallel beta-helix repeat-containing protein [Aestuariibacter sp.]